MDLAALNKKIWISSKDYMMIVLGLALYSFGFTAFILPQKVVMGGVAGLSSLIFFATEKMGYGVPIAVSTLAINGLLLLLSFRLVGAKFVLRTIFGVTVLSALLGVMQPMFSEPIVHTEPFMSVLIGGGLCGLGVGVAFTHNGSTGGTDIIAAMVSKYTNVTVGRTILYVDFVIISSSYLLFHSLDKIVYGLVVLFVISYVTDMVINTNRQAVQFTIFSKKWAEIADAINNDAHRGCTVLHGTGWFSKSDVKVLLVMCRKIEQITIFRIIKSIDADAFITQTNVNGVYGKGFDEMKVKIRSTYHPQPDAEGSNLDGLTTEHQPKQT